MGFTAKNYAGIQSSSNMYSNHTGRQLGIKMCYRKWSKGRLYECCSNLHSVESTQLTESTQILTQTIFIAWNKLVLNLSLLTWVRIWVTYFENKDCDWSVMTSHTPQTIIPCHIWCERWFRFRASEKGGEFAAVEWRFEWRNWPLKFWVDSSRVEWRFGFHAMVFTLSLLKLASWVDSTVEWRSYNRPENSH